MAGVKVPLVAMHHAYVVTERIEGIQVSSWSPAPHQAAAAPGPGSGPTHAGRHAGRQWPICIMGLLVTGRSGRREDERKWHSVTRGPPFLARLLTDAQPVGLGVASLTFAVSRTPGVPGSP